MPSAQSVKNAQVKRTNTRKDVQRAAYDSLAAKQFSTFDELFSMDVESMSALAKILTKTAAIKTRCIELDMDVPAIEKLDAAKSVNLAVDADDLEARITNNIMSKVMLLLNERPVTRAVAPEVDEPESVAVLEEAVVKAPVKEPVDLSDVYDMSPVKGPAEFVKRCQKHREIFYDRSHLDVIRTTKKDAALIDKLKDEAEWLSTAQGKLQWPIFNEMKPEHRFATLDMFDEESRIDDFARVTKVTKTQAKKERASADSKVRKQKKANDEMTARQEHGFKMAAGMRGDGGGEVSGLGAAMRDAFMSDGN